MTGDLGILKGREQHKRRRNVIWRDQWGRAWDGEMDTETLAPVGAPPFLKSTTSPIDIPPHYVVAIPGEVGRLRVETGRWKQELRERRREHRLTLQEQARAMYPNNYGDMLANPPRALLEAVGPGPLPVEFIEAMEAGNQWVLGLRRADGRPYRRPPWATALWDSVVALKRALWSEGEDTDDGRPPGTYPDVDEPDDAPEHTFAIIGAATAADNDHEPDDDESAIASIRRRHTQRRMKKEDGPDGE